MADVFLCHSVKDPELMKGVRDQATATRINYFIAPDSIPPGEKWENVIDRAIKECSWFIAFITPNALASEQVKREIALARGLNKKVISVVCGVPHEELPDYIKSTQYITRESTLEFFIKIGKASDRENLWGAVFLTALGGLALFAIMTSK